MYFYPRNRYLLVSTVKEEKEETAKFLLPDDYKAKSGPLQVVKLLRASDGSPYVKDENNMLLVPSHIIESLEFEGQNLELIPENAVYGVMVK